MLFGFVQLHVFASSGGLPVRANRMLAISGEVQSAMQGELDAREEKDTELVRT